MDNVLAFPEQHTRRVVVGFPDIDLARQRGRIDGRFCRHLSDGRTGEVRGIVRRDGQIMAKLWGDDLRHDLVPARLLVPCSRSNPL